jgi:hypothetical protein
MRKASYKETLLFLVLLVLSHASAAKLRGTRARRPRELNQHELLFTTEGRKGADGKDYKAGESEDESGVTGSTVDTLSSPGISGDVPSGPDSKQLGQTKAVKEGQTKTTKGTGTKAPTPTSAPVPKEPSEPGMKVTSGPATKTKDGNVSRTPAPRDKGDGTPIQSVTFVNIAEPHHSF